jgi:hypothetical protein
MDDKELSLLQEIDDLHKKLLAEPNGHRIGKVPIEPCPYKYCKIVDELVAKVRELRDVTQKDYALVLDQHIGSILGKEVNHVQLANSCKDKNQIVKLMQKANDTIDRHFHLIFQKIESLNTNSQN